MGHRRTAAAPDRRARRRPARGSGPVRGPRPDRGGVARLPRAGPAVVPRPGRRGPRPLPRARRARRPSRSSPAAIDERLAPLLGQGETDDASGTTWSDSTGSIEALRAAAGGHGMSHAWLFTGPPGSGRSNAAVAFAAALQCERGQGPEAGCGECHECHTVLAGSHADVTMVRTEKLSIGVDEVRDLVRALGAGAGPARRSQVIIVEDADRLTEQACNALLKAIEEPTARTVWMLCAPTVEDVLPTIRSRCRLVTLTTPTTEDVAAFLVRNDGVARVAGVVRRPRQPGPHRPGPRAGPRREHPQPAPRGGLLSREADLARCLHDRGRQPGRGHQGGGRRSSPASSTPARRPTSTRPTAWSSVVAGRGNTRRRSPPSSAASAPAPSGATSTWSTAG